MSPRKLPPIASDADRAQAAHIAADRLYAELREGDLARGLWLDERQEWEHFIDSKGGITSERFARQ